MAIFNEILSGRFNRALQKIFAIKGKPPVRQLGGEVLPIFDIHHLAVEYRYVFAEILWGAGLIVAASAGNLSAVRLRNPAGSGVIGVVEKITFSGAAAWILTRQSPDPGDLLGGGLSGSSRDLRSTTPVRGSVLRISQGNPATTSGSTVAASNFGGTAWGDIITTDDAEIVIAPNDSLTIYQTLVNSAATVTMFWRERAVEESETAGQ